MSSASTSRGWVAAASIGVVEALKDQGICRWNNALKSFQQPANSNVSSYSQAKRLPSQYSSSVSNKLKHDQKLKKFEESLRTVMYLSCWGPN